MTQFTVLVSGDREWDDYRFVYDTIRELSIVYGPRLRVIHGAARGADTLSGKACDSLNVTCEAYPAKWDEEGRAAGPIRNGRMLKEGKPNLVIAFHNHLDRSKGTLNMLTIATKAKVPCLLLSTTRTMQPWDATTSTIDAFQTQAMKAVAKGLKG